MGKLAFVFPGQGAQYVGMGKEFYEQISVSRKVYTIASEVTGLNLPGLCFEKNEQIDITEYTQIAMLTTEAAILAAFQEKGVKADVAAGLSLGEYGAILTAGHVFGGCVPCSKAERHPDAGSSAYRWCYVCCSWNGRRKDCENLRRDGRHRFGSQL